MIQGVDYFRFYDDSSSRNETFDELKPWVDTGVVSIVHTKIPSELQFNDVMHVCELSCKRYAFEHGFDLFFSLDLDEYLVPKNQSITAVEEMWNMFEKTGLYSSKLGKMNFNSAPHILEPIHLLTVEAYQTRMPQMHQMTSFKTAAPKLTLRLSGPLYSHKENRTQLMQCVERCTFHGCSAAAADPALTLDSHIYGKAFLRYLADSVDIPEIFHYSRSIEKFDLKVDKWRTPGGGKTAYDLIDYLDRNVGWVLDNRATRYGCQVRKALKAMTNQDKYYRPGTMWYRNVEFGLLMEEVKKGKRNHAPITPGEKMVLGQPYHYHGREWPFESYNRKKTKRSPF